MSKTIVTVDNLPATKQLSAATTGSGLAGMSAEAYLAKSGYKLHVEKNKLEIGGSVQQFIDKAYTFDIPFTVILEKGCFLNIPCFYG
ncbi:NAD(P)-binding protein [Mucilaginibacter terrae]|uniref:NAD(P)-binding protein n=1 Tax=Mucilaginibacter terrae TaxID=1955052 RepID=UPI0036382B5F